MSYIYGLFGEKLSHSISPLIHTKIFERINVDGYYHLFQIEKENLKKSIDGLKALSIKGVNVTIPYKISIMDYLDEIDSKALSIGSVNTIKVINDHTIGYNTDYDGFSKMMIKNKINSTGKDIVILGNGGVTNTVIQYFTDNKAKGITVVGRDLEKMKNNKKLKDHNIITYEGINGISEKDIIVNCTPCGMYPYIEECPIDKDTISKFLVAVDLIYNPRETLFMKYAKEQGIKNINGLYMLVCQAVVAEEIWNEIKIPEKTIEEVHDLVNATK